MNEQEIRAAVLAALAEVAPEAEGAEIDPQTSFRDQLDIDSVDFLNFLMALHESTGVDIPEADQAKLASLEGAVRYLRDRLG